MEIDIYSRDRQYHPWRCIERDKDHQDTARHKKQTWIITHQLSIHGHKVTESSVASIGNWTNTEENKKYKNTNIITLYSFFLRETLINHHVLSPSSTFFFPTTCLIFQCIHWTRWMKPRWRVPVDGPHVALRWRNVLWLRWESKRINRRHLYHLDQVHDILSR